MTYGPQTQQQFLGSLPTTGSPAQANPQGFEQYAAPAPAPKPALIPKAAASDYPQPERAGNGKQNIYQTPAFLEEQRRQGISPTLIADFIASKVGAKDPEFVGMYNATKQKYRNHPDAIDRFLNYAIYGTTQPDPSIIAQPLTDEEEGQPEEPGFFGQLVGNIGEGIENAGVGVREAAQDFAAGKQGLVDTGIQMGANAVRGVLSPVTGSLETVADATGLSDAAGAAFDPENLTPLGQATVQKAGELYGEAKKRAPQQLKTLEAVTGAALDASEVIGAGKVASVAAKGAKSLGKNAAQGVQEFMKTPPKIGSKIVQETDDDLWNVIQPKVTNTTIREAGKTNPSLLKDQKATFFKKGKIAPQEADKGLIETARSLGVSKQKDVIDNADTVWRAKKNESQALRSALEANDAALSHKEMNAAINKALNQVAEDFPGEEKVVQQIGKIWKAKSSTYQGKTSGHWSSRIDFDDYVENRYGKAVFEKGNARAEAIRAVRQTANDMIDKAARGKFKPQIKRISQMYDLLDNLSSQMGEDTLRSGASKFLRSPTGRAASATAKVGLGAAGVGIGLDFLKQ